MVDSPFCSQVTDRIEAGVETKRVFSGELFQVEDIVATIWRNFAPLPNAMVVLVAQMQ